MVLHKLAAATAGSGANSKVCCSHFTLHQQPFRQITQSCHGWDALLCCMQYAKSGADEASMNEADSAMIPVFHPPQSWMVFNHRHAPRRPQAFHSHHGGCHNDTVICRGFVLAALTS